MYTAGMGRFNTIKDSVISRCVLDLDGTDNILSGVTVRDSVVRYHGGLVRLAAVTFVNCTFILDIASPEGHPKHPDLLLGLLNSNQERITLSTMPS